MQHRQKLVGALALGLVGAFVAAEAAATPVVKPVTPTSYTTITAVIGRPLTPMSYAGVARRTVRRSYYY